MIGLVACLLAFSSTIVAGKRSLSAGLIALLAWGYAYGIIRANVTALASYFIFDAALFGFFIAQRKVLLQKATQRIRPLRTWSLALILWPCFVALLPLQNPLVTLVGLRGNIFFLPMLLVGAMLTTMDVIRLSTGLAILNVVALAFGAGEYIIGVPSFFPYNAITQIIYSSKDVAGYHFMRIPATFSSAHAYAGSMVVGIPTLFGAFTHPGTKGWRRLLCFIGIGAAFIGVLMAATRLHFVVGAVMVVLVAMNRKSSVKTRILLTILLAGIAFSAFKNERFGRFKSLGDSDSVTDRISGSVNRGFFEILEEYPIGNGMGGGGTSIPYFLQGSIRNPVGMENEYARILLEQGIIGLCLWIAFIARFLFASSAFVPGDWRAGRRLAWVCCCCYLGTGLIGIGTFTSIPQSVLLLIMMGWVSASPLLERDVGAGEIDPEHFAFPSKANVALIALRPQ